MNFNEEDKLCAIITVDGAWMDTTLRKNNPTPAIAVEADEQHSENSRFYRTLDYIILKL
jgi:acyl-CoA thioester hydrolase